MALRSEILLPTYSIADPYGSHQGTYALATVGLTQSNTLTTLLWSFSPMRSTGAMLCTETDASLHVLLLLRVRVRSARKRGARGGKGEQQAGLDGLIASLHFKAPGAEPVVSRTSSAAVAFCLLRREL
eukprot:1898834-Rhodomonas_salina.1